MYITINLTGNGNDTTEMLDKLFVASSTYPLALSILAFPLNILVIIVFMKQISEHPDQKHKVNSSKIAAVVVVVVVVDVSSVSVTKIDFCFRCLSDTYIYFLWRCLTSSWLYGLSTVPRGSITYFVNTPRHEHPIITIQTHATAARMRRRRWNWTRPASACTTNCGFAAVDFLLILTDFLPFT